MIRGPAESAGLTHLRDAGEDATSAMPWCYERPPRPGAHDAALNGVPHHTAVERCVQVDPRGEVPSRTG